MSYLTRDLKANLIRAIAVIEQIEAGEKDECMLSQVDANLKTNIALLKMAGHVEKPQRGRPKSGVAMTTAERVRKHRANKPA